MKIKGPAAGLDCFFCVPWEQQGGTRAQWADEMNGQFSSLVVGKSEVSLNVLQRSDILRLSPAGIHAFAEHQLVSDVSAGFDKWKGEWLMLCGCRNRQTIGPALSLSDLLGLKEDAVIFFQAAGGG